MIRKNVSVEREGLSQLSASGVRARQLLDRAAAYGPLPDDHAVLWGAVAPGALRGGIAVGTPA